MVGHSDAVPNHSALGFNADPVVDGGSNALLAAEVSPSRLNRDVPEEKLNLLEFTTRSMTEPDTCPSKVVRREPLYARFTGVPVPVSLVVPIARKARPRTSRNAQIAIVLHLPGTSPAMFISFR